MIPKWDKRKPHHPRGNNRAQAQGREFHEEREQDVLLHTILPHCSPAIPLR
jgi:hypothetical protein